MSLFLPSLPEMITSKDCSDQITLQLFTLQLRLWKMGPIITFWSLKLSPSHLLGVSCRPTPLQLACSLWLYNWGKCPSPPSLPFLFFLTDLLFMGSYLMGKCLWIGKWECPMKEEKIYLRMVASNRDFTLSQDDRVIYCNVHSVMYECSGVPTQFYLWVHSS